MDEEAGGERRGGQEGKKLCKLLLFNKFIITNLNIWKKNEGMVYFLKLYPEPYQFLVLWPLHVESGL